MSIPAIFPASFPDYISGPLPSSFFGSGSLGPLALNTLFGAVGDGWLAESYNNINAQTQFFFANGVITATMENAENPFHMAIGGNVAANAAPVATIAAQVPSCLAAMTSPGLVFVNGGLNNNWATDPIVSTLATIVQQFTAARHRVVLLAIPPAQPGNPYTDPNNSNANRLLINTALAALAAPNVLVFNSDGISFVSGDYTDQIHLTSNGFNKYGAALATYMAAWLPTGDTRTTTTSVYILNPTLGGGSAPPTQWTLDTSAAGGATVVQSIVGGKWRIAISGTYSGTGCAVNLSQTQTGSTFPANGEYVEGLVSYTIVGATPVAMTSQLNFTITSGGAFGYGAFPGTSDVARTAGRYTGKTAQIQTNAAATFNQVNVTIAFDTPQPSATAISGTFDFDYITMRKAS